MTEETKAEQSANEDPYAGMDATDGTEDLEKLEKDTKDSKDDAPSNDADEPEDQSHEEEADNADGDEGSSEEKPKRKKSAAERIDELTAKRREAERGEAAARAEVEFWKQQAQGKPEPTPEPQAPDPSTYDGGEFDPQYIRDLVNFESDRKNREFRESFEKEFTERQTQQAKQKRHEDFISALRADEEYGPSAYELVIDTTAPVTDDMAEIIMSSPDGAKIAAYLNENRHELQRISALPPARQAYEMGRLERTPPAKKQAETSPAPVPRTTQAPDPLPEATGRKSPASKKPGDMSQGDYERWANERQAKLRSSGW